MLSKEIVIFWETKKRKILLSIFIYETKRILLLTFYREQAPTVLQVERIPTKDGIFQKLPVLSNIYKLALLPCLTAGALKCKWNVILLLRVTQEEYCVFSLWYFLNQGLIQSPCSVCAGTSGAGISPSSAYLIIAGAFTDLKGCWQAFLDLQSWWPFADLKTCDNRSYRVPSIK